MRPTLRPGDACLIRYGARIRSGDLVVARLPARPLGVKRALVHDEDGWWLASDNPRAGTDSATFGSVADSDVLGRVVLRYWPRPALLTERPGVLSRVLSRCQALRRRSYQDRQSA
jgi:SOS-response transcriptional repressor LexA